MISYKSWRSQFFRPKLSLFVLFAFLANSLGPVPQVQAGELFLPTPGVRINLSPEYNPPILKGIKLHRDNPFRFDFILDKGDRVMPTRGNHPNDDQEIRKESIKLIKYFLATLTIPEQDLWVNLSPYEKNRIVPPSFGQTEMGRDLLAEDYMLKQITASLIYPEGETGKKFWKRIYAEASEKFGTTNIPVNTFNKVWIVPEKAVVYENAKAGTAYVVESRLKVMLEEDYLALSHSEPFASLDGRLREESKGVLRSFVAKSAPQDDKVELVSVPDILREIVIPELNKEVNQDKNFAQLRQVYNSLILATWYKRKIKDSILAEVYENKMKIKGTEYTQSILTQRQPGDMYPKGTCPQAGCQASKPLNLKASQVNHQMPNDVELIYQRYLQAFKKGAYNYIKEEYEPLTQETVPRKYFSGGTNFNNAAMAVFKEVSVFPQSNQGSNLAMVSMQANPLPGMAMSPRKSKNQFEDLLPDDSDPVKRIVSELNERYKRNVHAETGSKNAESRIDDGILDRFIAAMHKFDNPLFENQSTNYYYQLLLNAVKKRRPTSWTVWVHSQVAGDEIRRNIALNQRHAVRPGRLKLPAEIALDGQLEGKDIYLKLAGYRDPHTVDYQYFVRGETVPKRTVQFTWDEETYSWVFHFNSNVLVQSRFLLQQGYRDFLDIFGAIRSVGTGSEALIWDILGAPIEQISFPKHQNSVSGQAFILRSPRVMAFAADAAMMPPEIKQKLARLFKIESRMVYSSQGLLIDREVLKHILPQGTRDEVFAYDDFVIRIGLEPRDQKRQIRILIDFNRLNSFDGIGPAVRKHGVIQINSVTHAYIILDRIDGGTINDYQESFSQRGKVRALNLMRTLLKHRIFIGDHIKGISIRVGKRIIDGTFGAWVVDGEGAVVRKDLTWKVLAQRYVYAIETAQKSGRWPSKGLGLEILDFFKHEAANRAMSSTGGIDLTSDRALSVQNNGQRIRFHIDPAQLAQLQNTPGFVPVIINIEPIKDLRRFLGVQEGWRAGAPSI